MSLLQPLFCVDSEIIGQCSAIESSKVFNRLAEKTQVQFPTIGEHEVIRSRLTHSYEVATSATMMSYAIARDLKLQLPDIDYRGSVRACSLLHDCGHPPLGHDGAKMLDSFFREMGLSEGFSDNNNTLVVIEKNRIPVSNYTKASVIKYPDRLYPWQKPIYQPILDDAIEMDKQHFKNFGIDLQEQKTTIACQIMDEADRNTYICSDLKDFLSMGNTLPEDEIQQMAEREQLRYRFSELPSLFSLLRHPDKDNIAVYFLNLKNRFNENYRLTDRGLQVINDDLLAWREFLWKVEHRYYIKPLRMKPSQKEHFDSLMDFIRQVTIHQFSPSRTYRQRIQQASSHDDRMRAQRDMIAETTDYYATKLHKKAIIVAGTDLRAVDNSFSQGQHQAIIPDSALVMEHVMAEYNV